MHVARESSRSRPRWHRDCVIHADVAMLAPGPTWNNSGPTFLALGLFESGLVMVGSFDVLNEFSHSYLRGPNWRMGSVRQPVAV